MVPQRNLLFNHCEVASKAVLDHFSRFVNLSQQLHMHAILGGGGGGGSTGSQKKGGGLLPTLFHPKEIVASLTVV